ncbi:hypothetical protein [Henriciella litoralis]|uniref:hypothetical protein n=1 Tax=Henriciella litoralis TaxID=568102 RepID=UPI0009FD0517|nr:hypothetical protein [Henriciella litoralis]
MRILFGAILPLIAVFLVWSIGAPAPKSVFWDTGKGEITDYISETVETGYGPADLSYPVVSLPDGEVRRLLVENRHDLELVKENWPLGDQVSVRLHPKKDFAYALSDPQPVLWTAIVITAGAAVILIFFVYSFFREGGGVALFLAGVGTCFVMLPLILLRFMWTFGDPPPVSLFWPKETVEVVSNEITERPWAGGRIARTANIVVEDADGETAPLKTAGRADDVAAEFEPGTTHRVKRSPTGKLYQLGMRFPFFIAFLMSVIGPIAIGAGIWVITLIFRDPKGRVEA